MSQQSVKIEVKLSPEASNVLGVSWVTLDLSPGFSLREYKSVEGLSDINTIELEAILGFSVPFSTINDLAFLPFQPSAVDNRVTYVETRVQINGDPRPYDRIYYKNRSHKSRTWELEFQRASNHWAELAGKTRLCDLDLGTISFTESIVLNSWGLNGGEWDPDDHTGIVYPWVDYGGFVDQAEPIQLTDDPVKHLRVEDFRPWFSIPWLLQVGFCYIGWTLDGLILDSEFCRRMWAYLLSPTFYSSSNGGDFKLVGRYLADDVDLNADTAFIDTIDSDPGGNAIIVAGSTAYPGIINNTGYTMCFRFRFQGTITNSGSTQKMHSTLVPMLPSSGPSPWLVSGEIIAESYTEITAGQTLPVDIQLEVEIKPGDAVAFFVAWADDGINSNVGLTALKGFYIIVEPCQNTLIRGDVVSAASLIYCDYTLLDLFKGFLHIANGRLTTDWDVRTVTVYPENATEVGGHYLEGFNLQNEEPIDISEKVVCGSIIEKPIRNTTARYFRLAFKESTDAYIEDQDFSEPPYSRLILNDITLPDKTTDLENPFFEPTLEGQPEGLRKVDANPYPYLPRLWDNIDGNISYNIGPRIGFTFAGNIKQVDPVSGKDAGAYFETGPLSYFGYVSQKPTFTLVPQTGSLYSGGPLIFGNDPSDLFVTFYLAASLLRKRGTDIDLLVFMGQREYSNWNFRRDFYFPIEGFPTRAKAISIRDFASALEIPTPMTLIIEPVETQCCDLPCSCRFTLCDYYQDIGIYILQDTLDDLQITSFTVDGKEYVTTPVSLGVVNVIHFFGQPYVTNLVDALNALGVPYFTFDYSTRAFAAKSDWRFFSVKYPTCQSFEIIVSDSGGDVYRYTNDTSEQQWFGGTWSPFSYSGTDFGEPLGCTTILEY
ncbi:MAG: hypothetical protein KDC70_01210 [Saprospiraceae bacterium]|nr:hypothetical protein [Saprospiraceae bacterium]